MRDPQKNRANVAAHKARSLSRGCERVQLFLEPEAAKIVRKKMKMTGLSTSDVINYIIMVSKV
jgi:hypothetical protein